MPGSTLNIYNKNGSTLLGSGNGDLSYKVTDTGIIDEVDGSFINVAFSNSNVIGYSSSPNQTTPEYHIGSTNFGFGQVGTYNIYEVEGDKYSITTSKSNITINCKDKTMQKDLQITFSGGSGSLNWVELDYTNCSFDYESVFLSPEVSHILNDQLTLSGERMIIIRLIGTYLDDDLGDRTVKIMITFSQTDIYMNGGGAVKRGFYQIPTGTNKINVDATLDTINGTSIKIAELSSSLDFSNPNITLLDYVAIDI